LSSKFSSELKILAKIAIKQDATVKNKGRRRVFFQIFAISKFVIFTILFVIFAIAFSK